MSYITQSENVEELYAALASAQAELRNADKNRKAYNYNYADLSQILDISRPVLGKHGLAITQHPYDGVDAVGLVTRICHKSGQWMESKMLCEIPLTTKDTRIKQMGSMITYMRRYAMSAVLSISADEDNDGAAIKDETEMPDGRQQRKYTELLALADSMHIKEETQKLWLAKTGKTKWEDVPEQQVDAIYGKLLQRMRTGQNV